MRELYFDVWPGDDINGTSLGELTDAADKRYQGVFGNLGIGSFTINRHSSQYAWVTPGPTVSEPLIRVRRVPGGPFAYDSANYIGAFFVEEGGDTLLSPDEEGGEDAARSGRTVESMLARAIVDYTEHYADNIVEGFADTVPSDGQWHILGSLHSISYGTPGSVLRIFLRDWGAMTPEPIPEVTHDFSVDVDSIGTPWTENSTDWAIDVGTDGLEVLGIVVNAGLYYKMDPSLELHAYQDHPGVDRSATITFAKGVDIADAAEREIHSSPAKSRVLVEGQTKDGRRRYHWVVNHDLEDVIGVRQGKIEYGSSPTSTMLERAGVKYLTDLKAMRDGPPTMGVLEVDGQEAFVDYFPGDTVSVAIEGIYDDLAIEIHSITLVETETGECDTIVEFAGEAWGGLSSDRMGVCCATHIKPFVPGSEFVPGDQIVSIDENVTKSGGAPGVIASDEFSIIAGHPWRWTINMAVNTGGRITIDCTGPSPSQPVNSGVIGLSDSNDELPLATTVTGCRVTITPDSGQTMTTHGSDAGLLEYTDGSFLGGTTVPVYPVTDQRVIESYIANGTSAGGTTNHPYLPNSLLVYVGGVPVVPTQTDPAAGTFTLPFTPPAGTQVLLIYSAASSTATGAGNDDTPPSTIPNIPLAALTSLSWKPPVRVATTANITIASDLNAGDTIDGVTLAAGDRVLVKNQSTGSQNGIYVAGASPARATDFDDASEVMGAIVYVIAGTANGGKTYRNTNTSTPTIGSTSLTFAEFGGSSVGALDDLSDVVIASAAVGHRLRFDGTNWVNTSLKWKPVLAQDPTTGLYVPVHSGGDPVMAEG